MVLPMNALWKLVKFLLRSRLRGKAVRLQDIYSLALGEMSATLGQPPAADATITGAAKPVLSRLPSAAEVLAKETSSEFNIENPVQAMRLLAFSLETGIDRKLTIPARTLQLLNQITTDLSFSEAQKEQILHLAVESYLVGLLAPVTQFDLFSEKLDKLLLETRCATREEMMRELRAERAQNRSREEILQKLNELQQRDIAASQGEIEALDKHIHRLHCEYDDVDKWATVPDCVAVMADMLADDSFLGKKHLFSSESCRVNIQKRLRSRGVKSLSACNAVFYQTIDIATEAAVELAKYSAGQYLKEFNVIASPHDNLRRASTNKESKA